MSTKEDHIDDMMSVFEDKAITEDNVWELHVLRADGVENYVFVHYGHPVVHLLWDLEELKETPLRDALWDQEKSKETPLRDALWDQEKSNETPLRDALWDQEESNKTQLRDALWDSKKSEETPLRDTPVMDGAWLKMDTHRFNRGCALWKAVRGSQMKSMILLRVFRRVERLAEQEGRVRRHPHLDNDDGTIAPGLCLIM
jgi:hypothetical protein